MTTDALGGQIEVLFHNAPVLLPHLKAGTLRGIARIVASREIQERILSQASEPMGNRPEEYAAFIRAEIAKWRAVIKQANIKAE